ncbi:MAG: SIR2 family protein, partial [Gammaproteobacteria bacterium]
MTQEMNNTSWNSCNLYKVRNQPIEFEAKDWKTEDLRSKIEPWLTALFQSEHLSLLLGSGISSALNGMTKHKAGAGMAPMSFSVFQNQIARASNESACKSGRGEPNIEDQIRVCNELIRG